jgi:conjugal transfer pilus assembly protein TraW
MCACLPAFGGEAISIGPTYEILEPDTLEEIEQRTKATDWDAYFNKTPPEESSAFVSVDLPPATANRSYLFDPTYVLPRDIVDGYGRVLWPAGTKVNVYERIQTTARTIVIGDTPEQFRWLREVAKPQAGDRVYLAGGNVYMRGVAEQRKLFLLEDRVIERFGLRAVPSIVQQEGNRLRVEEFSLNAGSGLVDANDE